MAVALGVLITAAAGTASNPTRVEGRSADGCDDSLRPYRLGVTPPESGTLVVACGSFHVRLISLTNVSNTVLKVELPGYTTSWRVDDPAANSFGTRAALGAVRGGCYRDTLICNLPSQSTVFANGGSQAMSLDFSVQYGKTIKANSARFLGDWIENRFTPPAKRRLDKVIACASAAQNLAGRGSERTWDDALRLAVTYSWACSNLIKTVTESDVTTSAERAPVARQVVRLGRTFAGGTWIDELAYAAARLLRR